MKQPYAVAVVGLGGVFPSAPHVEAFWDNILSGYDATKEVPAWRWPADPAEFAARGAGPDGVLSLRACLLDDVPEPRTPRAKELELDDLSRLALVAAEMALADSHAGLKDRARVATILASIALPTQESSQLSEELFCGTLAQSLEPRPPEVAVEAKPIWRHVTGRPAEVVADALGLGGFTLTLDAACASSLYAVKLACDALSDHRVDAVLAGGANHADSLYTQAGFTALGALSPTGRCSPFDRKGNGLVVGEGAGFLLLKRHADALEQGDRIYAVIRGIGLSNDVGGSLLAPDSEGQLRALRQAYAQARWKAEEVGLVECHGTGTPMGDRTEFHSLKSFWSPSSGVSKPGGTVLGSVKSQIGHLLTGAGAAGLIKVIKAMEKRILPPTINFSNPARGIDFKDTPFRILSHPEPWVSDRPLRAGVSAFGFGGINGHVLLEEPGREAFLAPPSEPQERVEVVVTAVGLKMGQEHDVARLLVDRIRGESACGPRPKGRWPKDFSQSLETVDGVWGTYLQTLDVEAGEFRVPPKDMPEILLQQSLLLAAAHQATAQSSLGSKERCRRSGALIGISLDLETTNYHLRWALPRMLKRLGVDPDSLTPSAYQALRDALSRPLDSTRTLGALGSIAASRAAREFSLGGPSYAISCGELSGVRALEIAVRAIEHGEMDSCLVGAVDLAGDPRSLWAEHGRKPYAQGGQAQPFDAQGRGATVAEGAVALVLKSRAAALADGDRVLAVVDDVLASSGPRALLRNLEGLASKLDGKLPGFVDALSWADPQDDARLLRHYEEKVQRRVPSSSRQRDTAFGSLTGCLGMGGATAGLLSVVSAILALDSKIVPAIVGLNDPLPTPIGTYLPREPGFWWHDDVQGPRRAVSLGHSSGRDSHVVILSEGSKAGSLHGDGIRARALASQLFLVPLQHLAELKALAQESNDLAPLAQRWYQDRGQGADGARGAIVASDQGDLLKGLDLLERCAMGHAPPLEGQSGVFYRPCPTPGETAWVFPGSGNHYVGMGRELAVLFPEVAAQVSAEAKNSYQHFIPRLTQPFGADRSKGWQAKALDAIDRDPLAPIFGQVSFGILASRILGLFLPRPQAALGYSLGETSALFSMGAWQARDEMFERTVASPLFTSQLREKFLAAREVLGLSAEEVFHWRVAVVNRPEQVVREAIEASSRPDVFLLIVNTPTECVIGGQAQSVQEVATRLGCELFFLEGVPTVHCSLMHPVIEAYRELHQLPTTPPPDVRFYNGYRHIAYVPDRESAAESITENAIYGFSFPKLIRSAYADGVRQFIEIGPGGSCSRMIGAILESEKFWARSMSLPLVGEATSFLRLLACAHVHGSSLNLDPLYPAHAGDSRRPLRPRVVVRAGEMLAHRLRPAALCQPAVAKTKILDPQRVSSSLNPPVTIEKTPGHKTKVEHGSPSASDSLAPTRSDVRFHPRNIGLAPVTVDRFRPPRALVWSSPSKTTQKTLMKDGCLMPYSSQSTELSPVIGLHPDYAGDPRARVAASIVESTRQTALAHEAYLALMERHRLQMEGLLGIALGEGQVLAVPVPVAGVPDAPASCWTRLNPHDSNPVMRGEHPRDGQAWLNRAQCMEFAVGLVENVLGSEFAQVDRRPVRVRLPDEPLMLCDRMMSVEGEAKALTHQVESTVKGRLVTEHDVFPEAWYLDHDRAPVCIAVEAGQADLFLCAYLGIDLVTKEDRAYRLLDATISFHRGLPRPGETITYDIRANRFVRQGDVYLFFFEFDGSIDGQPFITMRRGCAGFHTKAEIDSSGGIVLAKRELDPHPGKAPTGWVPPAPFPHGLSAIERYHDGQIQAFRDRDLEGCFGSDFANLPLARPYGLPQGRMKLFDRVVFLQADGGRYGLGRIEAEADIHSEDWFLTCHFPDDMVMPGTLMYECCAHSLRFLLARLGWLCEEDEVAFEPRIETPAVLKCRGPVTVETKKVLYQVDIKEIGFGPEPYVLADALMFGDGKPIVRFEDMSMQLTGVTKASIDSLWANHLQGYGLEQRDSHLDSPPPALYDKASIMEFSNGRPSLAFGLEYQVFDEERRIARLPGPPYQFLDRVVEVQQPKFVLKAGDWIEAHYDVPSLEWYFAANRQDSMAYCILLEAALQPCGWLAAYVGSALRSKADLKFRNLGGTATLYREIFPSSGTMRMRVKMTEVSEAGGMIIENFAMQVWVADDLIYEGTTYFGFFSQAALANQVGIRDAADRSYQPSPSELAQAEPIVLPVLSPLTPEDPRFVAGDKACLPAKALLMVDRVDLVLPHGGLKGLGFIQGSKSVDPQEWFFKAHFYQDPVWPGSLGLEAFLQLIKFMALRFWPNLAATHRFESVALNLAHSWAYRGQVVPTNKRVVVDASITRREDGEEPLLLGHGFLRVDGIAIYEMTDFGVRLVRC